MKTKRAEWTKLGIVMFLWVSISIIGLNGYERIGGETMVQRRILLDKHDDYAIGDIDANPGYTNNQADTDGTYAKVADGTALGFTGKVLRVNTDDDAESVDLDWTLLFNSGKNNKGGYRFKMYPVDATDAEFPYITFILMDGGFAGGNSMIQLRFDLVSGDIDYFDGATKDTLINVNLDAINTVEVEILSTSTFRIKANNGNWSATLGNRNTITTDIDGINIQVQGNSGTGGDVLTCYFDEFQYVETSVGMQWNAFKQYGEDIEDNFGNSGMSIELSDGSVLFQSDDGIAKTTLADPDTWTVVLASADTWTMTDLGSGVIYAGLQTGTWTAADNMFFSVDYGDNWSAVPVTDLSNELRGYHFFNIGDGDVYAVFLHITETPMEIEVWKYDISAETWAIEDTYTSADNDVSRPSFCQVVSDTMFCFFADASDLHYLKWDQTAGSFTSIGTLAGFTTGVTVEAHKYYSMVNGNTIVQYAELGGASHLIRSLDAGLTWADFVSQEMTFVRSDVHDSDNKNWGWSIIDENSKIYYYDNNLGHLIKVFDLEVEVPDFVSVGIMIDSGLIILRNDESDGEVWQYTGGADTIKDCEIEGFGNEEWKKARWVVKPSDKGLFTVGDVVEFFDGYDTLAFKGKVTSNQFIRGVGQEINALPFKGELLEEPKDTERSFTTSATDTIVIAIVDTMDFLYQDGEIDSNGDFTITYTIEIKTPIKDYIHTARELERAVFLVTPAGEVQMYAYDQIPATGLIWRDSTFRQVNLKESLEVDMRLTRSEVIGAYVEGTSDNVEVRRDYIGNTAQESTEGVVRISLSRPQLTNDTEVLQLATNRFNIYGGTTRFIKLAPVKNQGFIQPGYTIDFSWAERDVTVPQGDYFIGHWKYNLKHDVYTEFWLTDSIVTYNEWKAVRQSIKRDDQISETYHFGETETTGDGVVCVQNPVARLRAGTTVWRIPEATDYDFDETDLDAVGNPSLADTWYDLDLSAIIPDGVKSVLFKIIYEDNLVDSKLQFRKNGQSNAIQTSDAETSTGTRDFHINLEVGVCIAQKLEFMSNIDIADWTDIRIVILAWRL